MKINKELTEIYFIIEPRVIPCTTRRIRWEICTFKNMVKHIYRLKNGKYRR